MHLEGVGRESNFGRKYAKAGRKSFKGCLAVRFEVRLLRRDAHSAVAAVTPSVAWEARRTAREPARSKWNGSHQRVPRRTRERRAAAQQSESMEPDLRSTHTTWARASCREPIVALPAATATPSRVLRLQARQQRIPRSSRMRLPEGPAHTR